MESKGRLNLAVASNFFDCVKNDELSTVLVTHYTPQCISAKRVPTKIQEIPDAEASDEIKLIQKQKKKFQ